MKIEQIATDKLIPYARNAKKHDASQVKSIAGSIKEFGFNNPVLIDKANGIIAGHGRVLAAEKLGLKEVPCIRLGHLTENQKRAYILADNRLAEMGGGWDMEMLRLELDEIDFGELDDFNLDDLGDFEFPEINKESSNIDDVYTNKIISPVYQPKGDCPNVDELYNRDKTKALIQEIDKSKIHDDIKIFLKFAAERHSIFNFRNIAEFYCHVHKDIQELMEKSGLVIIDLNKAIENGFVDLTEKLGKIADTEVE